MVETRTARTPAEIVAARLAADFPGLDVTVGERPEDVLSGKDRVAALVAAKLPDDPPPGLDQMAFPGDGPSAGLAILFRAGDLLLQAVRRFYLPPVVIAGAGPGGMTTMTVGAARAVERADVVLADALCGTDVLAPAAPHAEIIAVGKRCGKASAKQADINHHLVRFSRLGKRVVRLKGGDPTVFGRLEEEIGALGALGLPYRVIPGVGAASGAAAFVGQPLTVREVSSEVVFSTGRLAGGGKNPFPLSGRSAPTIALYMSRRVLEERMADLGPAGYPPDTPVVVVEKIGSPEARAVSGNVGNIAAVADRENVGTPAVVLVGKHFVAPNHLPLLGVRVWLPAEEETAGTHREALEELGATCVLEPLIVPEALPVDEGALFVKPFDWVLFTSKKSVDFLFDLLARWGHDSRWLTKVAAIGGPTIEKLRARGIEPDLIPPEHTRAALSAALLARGVEGERILIPASAVAPDHVREALAPRAAEVVRANLYTVRYPRVSNVPAADVVLFSSETTVKSARQNGLVERIRESGMLVGGIGPGTCRRLSKEGLPPAIVPEGTTPEDLARATRRYFANLEVSAMRAVDA